MQQDADQSAPVAPRSLAFVFHFENQKSSLANHQSVFLTAAKLMIDEGTRQQDAGQSAPVAPRNLAFVFHFENQKSSLANHQSVFLTAAKLVIGEGTRQQDDDQSAPVAPRNLASSSTSKIKNHHSPIINRFS